MKGISTIIAAILLVVITITLAGSAYLFFSGVLIGKISKVISIVSAKANYIIIRNDGTDIVASDDVKITVNGEQVEIINPQDIEPQKSVVLKFIPTDFGSELKSASINVLGPSNSLTYKTDIIPQESKSNSDTVALWHFNEVSSNKTYDSSGNNNIGNFTGESFNEGILGSTTTLDVNDPSRVNGKFGKALQFDGMDDYVKIPDSTSLDLNSSFTVEFWLKWSQYNYRTVMAKGAYDTSFGWFVRWASNTAYFRVRDSGANTADATMSINLYDDQWHHFVGLRDGNTVRIFIDGNEGTPADASAVGTILNDYAVTIGTRGDETTKPPTGIFDEVRIFDRALTPEEIQAEMQNSIPVIRPVASFSFEESGQYVNDTHIWVKGKFGSALSFDGIDDYIKTELTSVNNESFTLSAWINWNNKTESSDILSKPYFASLLVRGDANPKYVLSLRLYPTGDIYDTISLPFGWHHVAYTFTVGSQKLYRDGIEVRSTSYDSSSETNNNPFYIGSYDPGRYLFNGTIDEIYISNRTLSQEEILDIIYG